MKASAIFLLVLFSFTTNRLLAQGCTMLGQTPSTAFPVCGTSVFGQDTVPQCVTAAIPVNCNDGANYQDRNPFWYKFTCFTSGTLGFVITPNNVNDDYDWQLFDVTGHNPADVFTNPALFVSGNWSAVSGATGTSASASGNLECSGYSHPNMNAMPTIFRGHNYLLLVSHFTETQSGYKLSFGGGSASITDTLSPRMQSVRAFCDGSRLFLKLNKKMECSSVDADGSDFSISPALASVRGEVGVGCNAAFDMDSVVLTLSNPISPGNYSLTAKTGKDGNTLLDNCGNVVPAGSQAAFTVLPLQPTPMDSMVAPKCAPQIIQLVFQKPMLCSSIAPDGSDFKINGPYPVTVSGAFGNCDANGLSTVINIRLGSPMVHGGTYQVVLGVGTDGNTVIDECGQSTPAGSSLNFRIGDTVSAAIRYRESQGCREDSILFSNAGGNGINQWLWRFDNSLTSLMQDTGLVYTGFNVKSVRLWVSNGFCSDSSAAVLQPDTSYRVKAGFEASQYVCPNDLAMFRDTSSGNIITWNWDFGDGVTSLQSSPAPQQYPVPPVRARNYTASLVVQNMRGCYDTAYQLIRVLNTCYIAVPTAFTPNGDGINDYLYPLNAYKAVNLEFRVFNRLGQLVFETRDWTRKWDGTFHGVPQPMGAYVWFLRYTDGDTGQKHFLKGSALLIR